MRSAGRGGILAALATLVVLLILVEAWLTVRLGAQQQQEYDPTGARLLKFHAHYDPFFRRFFGCPAHGGDTGLCRPAVGVRDEREYKGAREAAKALFGLR